MNEVTSQEFIDVKSQNQTNDSNKLQDYKHVNSNIKIVPNVRSSNASQFAKRSPSAAYYRYISNFNLLEERQLLLICLLKNNQSKNDSISKLGHREENQVSISNVSSTDNLNIDEIPDEKLLHFRNDSTANLIEDQESDTSWPVNNENLSKNLLFEWTIIY